MARRRRRKNKDVKPTGAAPRQGLPPSEGGVRGIRGLVLVVVACGTFLPSVSTEFLWNWDDQTYVSGNPLLRDSDGLARIWTTFETAQYYPLTFTLYWLESQLWGQKSALGYRVMSIVLHCTCVWVVFRVWLQLGVASHVGWLAAFIFAVHPMQVATVAWVAEQKNLLSFLGVLVSLWFYTRSRERGSWKWGLLSILSFAGALLGKTAVIAIPLVFPLGLRLSKRHVSARDWLWVVPHLVIGGILSAVTAYREGIVGTVPDFPLRLALIGNTLFFYLTRFVIPAGLSGLYPRWNLVTGSLLTWMPLVLIVAAALALWWRRRDLQAGQVFGLAWALAALAPILGFVPFDYLGKSFVADHFIYSALPGLALAVVLAFASLLSRLRTPQHGRVFILALAVIMALLASTGFLRSRDWRNASVFWDGVVRQHPDSVVGLSNLGMALAAEERYVEAVTVFERLVKRAPKTAGYHANLGNAYFSVERYREAVLSYQKALELDPDNKAYLSNMGAALNRLQSGSLERPPAQ